MGYLRSNTPLPEKVCSREDVVACVYELKLAPIEACEGYQIQPLAYLRMPRLLVVQYVNTLELFDLCLGFV